MILFSVNVEYYLYDSWEDILNVDGAAIWKRCQNLAGSFILQSQEEQKFSFLLKTFPTPESASLLLQFVTNSIQLKTWSVRKLLRTYLGWKLRVCLLDSFTFIWESLKWNKLQDKIIKRSRWQLFSRQTSFEWDSANKHIFIGSC